MSLDSIGIFGRPEQRAKSGMLFAGTEANE